MFKLKRCVVALSTLIAITVPITGTTQTWMEDYFTSAGAAVNVTPADTFETQTQTGISLGGVGYRTPKRNFQPFSFSPPGFKAGCGGIDAWLGAYGFANADQFIAALRNIGQNSLGYFFQLSLKTMAPEIDAVLNDISKKIQAMNDLNVNSCEAAKRLVDSATNAGTKGASFEENAKAFGSAISGVYSDWFSAEEKTKDDPDEAQKTVTQACNSSATLCKDSDGTVVIKKDVNVLFEALRKKDAFTPDEIDLIISAIGTVIFKSNTSDVKSGFEKPYYPPTIKNWSDFIGTTEGDGYVTLDLIKCPDYDTCMYGASYKEAATNTKGFAFIVKEGLLDLKNAIVGRTVASNKAKIIVTLTSVPIYELITSALRESRGSDLLANQVIETYATVIANEIAYNYLTDIATDADVAIKQYQGVAASGDFQELDNLKGSINTKLSQAYDSYSIAQANATEKSRQIEMILSVRRTMNSGFSKSFQENMMFAEKAE